MPPTDTAREVQHLLSQQDFGQALQVAERWVQKQPGVLAAWMGVARAALGIGMLGRADSAITRAFAMAPKDPQVIFFRSAIDHRIGRSDVAIERLQSITPAQVQSVAARYFGDERLTVGILRPLPRDAQPPRPAPSPAAAGLRH
jgi:predicted Zn-dependent protease